MAKLTFFLLATCTLAITHLAAAATSFGGVNHFFLAALSPSERQSLISTLHGANTRVIRTFLRPEDYSDIEKGNPKSKFPDVESPLGTFDTNILDKYDDMLHDVYRLSNGRIKVLLGLHDANMLAGYTQPCEAYCQYLKQHGNMNWGKFYTDPFLRQAYKNRLQKILVGYKSKNFGGKSWGQLSEVLFGIDLQNEPGVGGMQDLVIGTGWVCDISKFLRGLLSPGIAVATGGIGGALAGTNNFPDEVFGCPAVDVISLHGYFSRSGATSAGQPWCNLLSSSGAGTLLGRAKAAGKLVMVEEWVYQNNGDKTGVKNGDIAAQGHALNALGIPWTYWDVITGNEACQGWCGDNEVSVSPGGSPSGAWDALKSALGEAGKVPLVDGQDWSRFLETAAGGVGVTDGTCGKTSAGGSGGGGGGGGGGCTWGCLGWECSAKSPCQGDLDCNGSRVCSSCTWGCAGWKCSSSSPCKDQLQCVSGTCQKCTWGCLGWSCSASSPCSGEFDCVSGVCKPCTWGCHGWSCSTSSPCRSGNVCSGGVCKPSSS